MSLSAYIDAIGELDGNRCLMDWKTTTSRYPSNRKVCCRSILN